MKRAYALVEIHGGFQVMGCTQIVKVRLQMTFRFRFFFLIFFFELPPIEGDECCCVAPAAGRGTSTAGDKSPR
jgi:hypothetical protein